MILEHNLSVNDFAFSDCAWFATKDAKYETEYDYHQKSFWDTGKKGEGVLKAGPGKSRG